MPTDQATAPLPAPAGASPAWRSAIETRATALLGALRRPGSRAGARSGTGPIGLEIAQQALHLVQLQGTAAGSLALQASASVPYEGERATLLATPARLKALLRSALGSGPFRGRRVVTALPADSVRILPIHYESAGQDDAKAILKVLGDRLGGDLSRQVIDYIPVRSSPGQSERLALAAFAPREGVLAYLEPLRHAGLSVDFLEVGPTAIRRLVTALGSDDYTDNTLAINFGETASYLTMISGRRLLMDQAVSLGQLELLAQLGKALQMPESEARALVDRYGLGAPQAPASGAKAEEIGQTLAEIIKPSLLRLAEEVNRALIYIASETRGAPVDRIYLLGSLARWRGMDRLLSAQLAVPVATLDDPLRPFRVRRDAAETGPVLAIATGLALRGMLNDA